MAERKTINLLQSINTKSVDESVHAWDDPAVLHPENTGAVEYGGLTNLYEKQTAFPVVGANFITERGKVLSAEASGATRIIRIDGKTVGIVSKYGIESREIVDGCDDAVLTNNGRYLTAKLSAGSVTVNEYDMAGLLTGTRTTAFSIMAGLSGITSLSFVRFTGLDFADDLEFIVRIGDRCIFLREASPAGGMVKLGTVTQYAITAACLYGTTVVFGTYRGKIFSVDANGNYRMPDGTGTGTGPYNDGSASNGLRINTLVAVGAYLIGTSYTTGVVSYVFSWDGTAWRAYNGTGSGLGPWATNPLGAAINTLASCNYSGVYVVAGGSGRLSSWAPATGWRYYSGAGAGTGPFDNGTVIGAVNIYALTYGGAGAGVLVVAGASGRLGNWNGAAWTTYLGGGLGAEPFNNGVVIGGNAIYALTYYGVTTLIVAGAGGRLGNYVAAWTTYLGGGAGAEPFTNAAALGAAVDITDVEIFAGTYLVLVGNLFGTSSGRLASWEAIGGWITYAGAGAGTGPWANCVKNLSFGAASIIVPTATRVVVTGNDGNAVFSWIGASGVWETVYSKLNVPGCHFNEVGVIRSFVFKDANGYAQYLIVAHSTFLSSFDGQNWKYWDGTGAGTGPFDNATVLGGAAIYAFAKYGTYLIVAGDAGRLGNWNSATGLWFTSAGGGGGGGPRADGGAGSVIDGGSIWALCNYSTFLIVAGAAGLLGSWDGAAWKDHAGAGAGTGPSNNATVIDANVIYTMCVYRTFLVVAGVGGLLGSWDGAAWVDHAGAGGGTGPWNNNTVTATNISAVRQYRRWLVVGGTGLRVGSWDGTAWKNHDGTLTGTGPYNGNVAAYATYYIDAFESFSEILYGAITNGGLISFDGSAWKLCNGSGTGGAAWRDVDAQPVSFTFTHSSFVHWNGCLVRQGFFELSYKSDITHLQALWGDTFRYPVKRGGPLMAWNFLRGTTDHYIVGSPGATENYFYIFAFGDVSPASAKYAVMQRNGFGVRAILYGHPSYFGTMLEAVGLVGYIDWMAFTAPVRYDAFNYAVDTMPSVLVGPGSEDLTFTLVGATNVYSYISPTFNASEAALFSVVQVGTNTPVGAYGKLTNAYGLAPSDGIEFRVLWVNGAAATLSASIVDGSDDTMGVLLSAVGEFDEAYAPHVMWTSILYRANGRLTIVNVGDSPVPMFQKIDSRFYKVNTLHPLNLYDDEREALEISSSDFNGRAVFSATATPATVAKKFASVLSSPHSGGIDVGDKLVYITTLDSSLYRVIGNRLPSVTSTLPGSGIDVYIEDLYVLTVYDDGSELVDPAKLDLLYIPSVELPIPVGWMYGPMVSIGDTLTVFVTPDRDTYTIGNELEGQFVAFTLFGQRYLFDGFAIHLANFTGNVLADKRRMASAGGMNYLCAAPSMAFFVSEYDNSLFTFDGGQALSKFEQFSKETEIYRGVFSVRDGTLLLEATDRFIWIRDGIITRNLKNALQSALRLYDTVQGLMIGNDTYSWQYSPDWMPASTVVPLSWRSGYYGTPGNQKSVLTEWVLTVINAAKTKVIITGTCRSFDAETYAENTETWTILPADWAGVGYVRLRIRPKRERCLASSVGISTPSKVLLQDVVAEVADDAKAIVPQARSR